jgi:transcription antitermination factor NusG
MNQVLRQYTAGLKVVRQVRHRMRRVLPIAGDVLVKVGQRVDAQQVVAETFMPGDVTPLNLASVLSISAGDVKASLLKPEGERVAVGELLARTKGIFGLFKNEYRAKTAGTIESVSAVTGQVILRGQPIPVQVRAYLSGTVIEVLPQEGVVLEADVTLIQGIFGIGGEAYGPITMACRDPSEELTAARIQADMKGAVVIGGGRMEGEAIRKAVAVGVSALVSGGIDDQDLKETLGYDLGVAVTGSEKIGLTLIVTEGFGDIAMAERTFRLLASRTGASAAVNGATQIRAGVMRPEIVIPIENAGQAASIDETQIDTRLEPGATVRIIRDPYFGRIGKVAALPQELRVLDSGSKARVLEVAFDSQERIVVPRANVELIES